MMDFLAKYFILPRDYIKLFSNSDIIDIEEVKKDQRQVYWGILATALLNILRAGILIWAFRISVEKQPDTFIHVLLLFFIALVLSGLKSVFENYNIGVLGPKTYHLNLLTFSSEVDKLKSKDISKTFNELYSTGTNYSFYIQNYFGTTIKLGVLFATIFILQQKASYVIEILLLSFVYFTLTIVFGYFFYHKGALAVRTAFLNGKKPTKKDLFKRVSGPVVSNFTSGEFISFASIFIILLGIPEWAFFIVISANLQSALWNLISTLESLKLAKLNIDKVNDYFADLNKTYIYNENTYKQYLENIKELYKNQKPTTTTGLELINYAPMNGSKNPRIFNFHFKQGMYKLIGINGVGKTTLLKSFGLTNDYLVEKPTGYAFLNGEALFKQEETLKKHRQKVIFLSKNTKIPELKTNAKYKALTSSELILNLINNIRTRETITFSEGEAAIVEILNSLIDIPNKGILIIDELLARIHDGDVYNVRTELIDLIGKICDKKSLIVITVDHAIEIEKAILVNITENSLKLK